MRENLIELIRGIDGKIIVAADMTFEEKKESMYRQMADHLIANGVTLQNWIPVSERLPDAWVDVLSCDRNKNLTVDCVDKKGKWYSEYKDLEEVTHWMPLPDPPKGE